MDIEDFLAQNSIRVFHTQKDAIEHQQEEPDARLFSFESRHLNKGRRRFICTPLKKFYEFYGQQVSDLHFYEIIQEGHPCRAYFDLEYRREFNENVDSLAYVQNFVALCCETIHSVLNLRVDVTNFLILDSSTETKFSAHIIIHLPDQRLFANHLVLKQFVNLLTTEMVKQKFTVMKEDDKQTFLCDESVYTKNRNFRLYYSSKWGTSTRLEYASYCNFYAKKPMDMKLFYDTLIVPENYKQCPLIELQQVISASQLPLVSSTPVVVSSNNTTTHTNPPIVPIDETPYLNQFSDNYTNAQVLYQQQIPNRVKSSKVQDLIKLSGPSPLPMLDKWFIKLIRENFPKATIRLWTLSYVEAYNRRQIQYSLNGCRFCHNLKREHKRQNVYWIVNLEEFYAYQRCFDSDCRSFTSEQYPIPEDVARQCQSVIGSVFEKFGIQSDGQNDENLVDTQKDVEVLDVVPNKVQKLSPKSSLSP